MKASFAAKLPKSNWSHVYVLSFFDMTQISVSRGSGYQQGYSYRGAVDPNVVLYGLIGVNVAVWALWQVPDLQPFMARHFLVRIFTLYYLKCHLALYPSQTVQRNGMRARNSIHSC